MIGLKQLVGLEIPKGAVEKGDTEQAVSFFRELEKLPDDNLRNRFHFCVSGYVQDLRELGEIAEVRQYFKLLYEQVPSLFYWLDLESQMPALVMSALLPCQRVTGGVEMDQDSVIAFLEQGLKQAVQFCSDSGRSAVEVTRAMHSLINAARKRPA